MHGVGLCYDQDQSGYLLHTRWQNDSPVMLRVISGLLRQSALIEPSVWYPLPGAILQPACHVGFLAHFQNDQQHADLQCSILQ